MFSIFVIGGGSQNIDYLCAELAQNGYTCVIGLDGEDIVEQVAAQSPDLVLVDNDNHTRIKKK